jgi:hypothetical protein
MGFDDDTANKSKWLEFLTRVAAARCQFSGSVEALRKEDITG